MIKKLKMFLVVSLLFGFSSTYAVDIPKDYLGDFYLVHSLKFIDGEPDGASSKMYQTPHLFKLTETSIKFTETTFIFTNAPENYKILSTEYEKSHNTKWLKIELDQSKVVILLAGSSDTSWVCRLITDSSKEDDFIQFVLTKK